MMSGEQLTLPLHTPFVCLPLNDNTCLLDFLKSTVPEKVTLN
jgi:hypothetical protein